MSETRLRTFRSFITERFTDVAVEIFGEVEAIVEAYYEENKRLRNILHMVLNPEIKLPRIDVTQRTREATDVREQPPEPETAVELEVSEPLPKKLKEEEIECDLSWGAEQRQEPGGADNAFSPACVKDDPDKGDTTAPCITSHNIKVVEYSPDDCSATVSADEANGEHEDGSSVDSDAVADSPHVSGSEESDCENQEAEKHENTPKTKKCGDRCTCEERSTVSVQSTNTVVGDRK